MTDLSTEATLNVYNNIITSYQLKFLSNFKVQCIPNGRNYNIVVPYTYVQWFKKIQELCMHTSAIDDNGSLVIYDVSEISYTYTAFNGQFTKYMNDIFRLFDGPGFDALVKECTKDLLSSL